MERAAGLALTALRGSPAVSTASAGPAASAEPAWPVARPTPAPSVGPPRDHCEVLRVSTESMPYLRDHCFFRQRAGWPDESDRRPVMPATTIIWHMVRIAERACPGRVVTEIGDLQLMRWLAAAPPADVTVTVRPAPAEATAQIVFGEFSTASVTTAARYPAERPRRWSVDRAAERLPQDTAAQMYEGRLMFHGPAFQGVTELSAMGPRHIRGIITTPRAPGALLDCAGQILGYWIIRSFASKTRVLPVHLDRVRYWGTPPSAGTPVECHVQIVHIDEGSVTADIQLVRDGLVWAELSGWRNRRFDNHPETQAVENFPEYRALSREQPGGWVLLFERWNDLASRDLVMRNHLGAAERAEFEACPPLRRRHWLLGRVAAKDAVRTLLWEQGEDVVFPAEVRVRNDPSGQPRVSGMHGRKLPPLSVSIAHCGEAAAAMVRSEASGGAAGIDVEEVADRPARLVELTLSTAERDLLAALAERTGEPARLWFTRMWAAKEAAAKAAGTRLQGEPRRFQVHDVRGPASDGQECLVVTIPGTGQRPPRDVLIRFATIRNPPDLPPREYVVAWTT
jgi:phosphopantetheinyl transferase